MISSYNLYAKKFFNSKKTLTIISVLVTTLVVIYLVYKVYEQWQLVSQYSFTFNFTYLILAFLPFSAAHLLVAFNWNLILAQFGAPISFRRNLKVYSYANAMSNLPGGWWYIVGRAYGYSQDNIPKRLVVFATALERTLLVVAGIIISMMALPILSLSSLGVNSVWLNVWMLIFFLVALSILLSPPILNRIVNFLLKKFTDDGSIITIRFADLMRYLVINLVVLALSGMVIWCLVNVIYPLGITTQIIGLTSSFALSLIVANLLFWVPQFGIKDGILALAMSLFIPAPIAVVTVILMRIWTIIGNLSWLAITSRL